MMRIASERLATELENARQGWREVIAGYAVEEKMDTSWGELRLALGIQKKEYRLERLSTWVT